MNKFDREKADNYVVKFGKHKGKKLQDIPLKELDSYLGWLEKNAGGNLAGELTKVLTNYLNYYKNDLEKELF